MFRERLLMVVELVVGYKFLRYRSEKGNVWWTDEMRNAVEDKKRTWYIA